MSNIRFRITAGTDVGLVRSNNEDNFILNADLTRPDWYVPQDTSSIQKLGDEGCVLVVADGMGGLNAGEVASAIAVEQVQQEFLNADIKKIACTEKKIENFLFEIIDKADIAIKQRVNDDPSTKGMGTTIILAWIIGNKVHLAWCGDSRAYIFNKSSGLRRISKDHSYVQQLVDAGKIDEESAFNHPNSNIITRCLGDYRGKANPEYRSYTLSQGDNVMLCTDGLCGLCRDEKILETFNTYSEDIETCKQQLINEALNAGGYDNVTIALFEATEIDDVVNVGSTAEISSSSSQKSINKSKITKIAILIAVAAIILLILNNRPEILEYIKNLLDNK